MGIWESAGRGRTIRARTWGVGTGGAVVAIAAVMLIAPMAAGAGHTYKPPYTSMAAALYSVVGSGACGATTVTTPLNWSSTTGVMIAGAKTSAKGCASQVGTVGGSSYGEYEAETLLGMTVKIPTAGAHAITVNWKVNAATTTSFTPGTCYGGAVSSTNFWYCESLSEWEIFGQAELVDQTNGSVTYSSNFLDVYNESYNETFFEFGTYYNSSGVFGFGTLGAMSLFVNATTVAGHTYAVVTYIEVIAESALEAYNAGVKGGSATASVNMGTGGNKATLTSISVV